MEKFETVPTPPPASEWNILRPEAEDHRPEVPLLTVEDKEELDRLCSLDVSEEELAYARSVLLDAKKAGSVIHVLAYSRNIEDELPVSDDVARTHFAYNRNKKECERLRRSLLKLLAHDGLRIAPDDSGEPTVVVDDQDEPLLRDTTALLVLELRKAQWLERNYHPVVFERAVAIAKGDINQFLIAQRNIHALEQFRNPDDTTLALKDELTYLADGHDPESQGEIQGGAISLRIPSSYSPRDEWKVYLTTVHELVHYVSYRDHERLGVHHRAEEPDLKELNEAITQLATYSIAREHTGRSKTALKGQKEEHLSSMPYAHFTIPAVHLLAKYRIPRQRVYDAMLNEDGLERLAYAFRPDSLEEGKRKIVDFGRNIKELYEPRTKKA